MFPSPEKIQFVDQASQSLSTSNDANRFFFRSVRLGQRFAISNKRLSDDIFKAVIRAIEVSSLLSSLGCNDSGNADGFACFSNPVGVTSALKPLELLIVPRVFAFLARRFCPILGRAVVAFLVTKWNGLSVDALSKSALLT